ncbi:MAG: hypothetical protein EOO56_12795, partial [Hymenobacter sp.]
MMSLRNYKAMLLLSLPLLAACATTAPTAPVAVQALPTDTVRKATAAIPAEDLTKYRPTFAPAPAAPASGPAAPRATAAPGPEAGAAGAGAKVGRYLVRSSAGMAAVALRTV